MFDTVCRAYVGNSTGWPQKVAHFFNTAYLIQQVRCQLNVCLVTDSIVAQKTIDCACIKRHDSKWLLTALARGVIKSIASVRLFPLYYMNLQTDRTPSFLHMGHNRSSTGIKNHCHMSISRV